MGSLEQGLEQGPPGSGSSRQDEGGAARLGGRNSRAQSVGVKAGRWPGMRVESGHVAGQCRPPHRVVGDGGF